ncbi:MAG: COG1470 family protein [Fimbriimonadales bacterium]
MAIRVRLGQDEVQVEPGGSAQLVAVVRNEGDTADQVALEVEGVDAEWCAIPIPSFTLAPGEEVQERILIRPPRSTESRAGTYPILVRARSLENGGTGLAQASVTIRPYSMLTLEITPKRGIASPLRKRVPYELSIENYGNTEQTVQLHVSDPEDEVVFELERERTPLAPGETQSVWVYAQPRRMPTLANPALFSFTATARSVEDPLRSTSVQAQLERRGLISPLVLGFLAVLGLLLALWSYTRPLPVEIEEFAAQPAQITAGETTTLLWRVRNADKVIIEPSVGERDPSETRSVQVQPTATTTYRLIARNRYGEQMREVVVIVQNAPEPPLPVIKQFFADPPQIKRGESVLLRWQVENATELILTPPGGQKLDPALPGFEHRPSRTTEYELIARNAAGKVVSKKIKVEVIDPSQAQILGFTAQAEQIVAGESVVLRWELLNAVRAEIDNGIGRIDPKQGEMTVSPTTTTTYTLTAYDLEGRPAQAKVTVKVEPRSETPADLP